MRAVGAKDHVITVTGKRYRTDYFVRVDFLSESLLSPDGEAPGNWIRAWFPDAGDRGKHYQRGYTLLDPNPTTGEFSIDFVLRHPMGPASNWAANCEQGDEILAMRYGEEPFTLSDPAPNRLSLSGRSRRIPRDHLGCRQHPDGTRGGGLPRTACSHRHRTATTPTVRTSPPPGFSNSLTARRSSRRSRIGTGPAGTPGSPGNPPRRAMPEHSCSANTT